MTLGERRIVDDEPEALNLESRSDGTRDSDRVLYSSAFRRMAGVTQVVSPRDEYVFHDRAMHSLKVAQVGQRLSEELKERGGRNVDSWVVHAAALAHDLGHPPFGHAAEQELQGVLQGVRGREGDASTHAILRDSFEGNAQTFRIVSRLAARKPEERLPGDTKVGLNLSWRTYSAILKYPWTHGQQPERLADLNKWGAYDSEKDFLDRALEVAADAGLMGTERSVEAAIMDWADDVAYAVHDTEDFFRAKLIPLDRLKRNHLGEWDQFLLTAKPKVREALQRNPAATWSESTYDAVADNVRLAFPDYEYSGDSGTREALHLFASSSIKMLTREVEIQNAELSVPPEAVIHAEILKKLTKYYVIDHADLAFDQHGQRRLVRALFFGLWDMVCEVWPASSREGDRRRFPSRLREYCDDAFQPHMTVYGTDQSRLARATVDFICSLTDRQAMLLAARLAGSTSSSSAEWVSV